VSLFFVNDHVVAKKVGRNIPFDIFRVALPSPPHTPIEGFAERASDVMALYGAVKLQVDYTFNGQRAEDAIYNTLADHLSASRSWAVVS
jgi:hypothetical protein